MKYFRKSKEPFGRSYNGMDLTPSCLNRFQKTIKILPANFAFKSSVRVITSVRESVLEMNVDNRSSD